MEAIEEAWPFTRPEAVVSNQKTAAEKNRVNVLGLIARRQCLSQRQLTLATGLQASTIYNIVRALKEQGVVRDGPPIKAERAGPKETELEIKPDYMWCAGVSLDVRGHLIRIINACGQTLEEVVLPTPADPAQFVPLASEMIIACSERLKLRRKRLGGVGISVPGVVDPDQGTIVLSQSLKIESLALKAPIEQALGCPAWVERNVACGAYAEHNSGITRDRDSFIYFWLRTIDGHRPHLGLSLVINEKVFRGCNSAAGQIDNALAFGHNASEMASMAITPQTADVFYNALANTLANIVNLLDMRCIVFASNDENLTPERFATLQELVSARLVPLPSRSFEMVRSQLGMDAISTGSALLALHRGLAYRLLNSPN